MVAARDAALDAALDAAWYAARVAAGLVVREVISTTNYDLLTGLWRSTIGPIHPDDPDWTETP